MSDLIHTLDLEQHSFRGTSLILLYKEAGMQFLLCLLLSGTGQRDPAGPPSKLCSKKLHAQGSTASALG